MSEIKPNTILQRVELLGSQIDDEIVFFDQQAGKYYATGAVGADVWHILEHPKSFAEICDHLVGIYEVDRPTCEAEVAPFVRQMLTAGILIESPD